MRLLLEIIAKIVYTYINDVGVIKGQCCIRASTSNADLLTLVSYKYGLFVQAMDTDAAGREQKWRIPHYIENSGRIPLKR